jgi:hypothetical protein
MAWHGMARSGGARVSLETHARTAVCEPEKNALRRAHKSTHTHTRLGSLLSALLPGRHAYLRLSEQWMRGQKRVLRGLGAVA